MLHEYTEAYLPWDQWSVEIILKKVYEMNSWTRFVLD